MMNIIVNEDKITFKVCDKKYLKKKKTIQRNQP